MTTLGSVLGPSSRTPPSVPDVAEDTVGAVNPAMRTCLVAVDGSVGSVRALVWGCRYAIDVGMRVEVLTVWPPHRGPLIHEVPGHFSAARWSARTAQDDAVRAAVEEVRDGPIAAVRLENADVGTAIVRASSRCDLLVVGADAGDSSHSLTARIAEGAACDVVVVVGSAGPSGASQRRATVHPVGMHATGVPG